MLKIKISIFRQFSSCFFFPNLVSDVTLLPVHKNEDNKASLKYEWTNAFSYQHHFPI